ncbi:MAG: SIR2 family protein [Desulfitobacteriia bacterium]
MGSNIIKVRDDHIPLTFTKSESTNSEVTFALTDGQTVNWCSDNTFSITDLRGRIEPWLTSLFQSEHLSLLVGSGLTTAIQFEATGKSDNGMGNPTPRTAYAEKITTAVNKSVEKNNRGDANIEDYIRIMNDLLRGLEILKVDEEYSALKIELDGILADFALNITQIENQIAVAEDKKRTNAFNKLVLFLMSFASRTGTRDRLNIFTTNYDRLIEVGAELAGLHLLDRFVGTLSPIFRSSRLDLDMHYNPPGIRGEPRYLEGVTRFTKLHGSVDWVDSKGDIRKIGLPFGATDIKPYLSAPGLSVDSTNIMIYPNASKDRETAEYPYVELFRDLAAALCRPNSTLITYGYSFGDEHINRIIRDMLTIPSTHLVVIAFDDKTDRIMKNYMEMGRTTQISLLIGPDVAGIDPLTSYFLPKPSIDRNTIRMAELLKKRYEQPQIPHEEVGGAKS